MDFEPVKAKAAGATAFPSMPQPVFDALPTRFVDSAVGPVPEGWEVVTYEELVDAKQGKYLPKKKMTESAVGPNIYPVWGGNGVRGFTDKCMYEQPVVVLTCRGSNCGLINLVNENTWVSNIAFGCRPKIGSVNFLYNYFSLCSFEDCISGSAQPQITYSALKGKLMTFPLCSQLVSAYSDEIDFLYAQYSQLEDESEKLAEMRDYLLPKLLSGSVRVSYATAVHEDEAL